MCSKQVLCRGCKSELNAGASRCVNCGQHTGRLGAFYTLSSVVGAVVALISLLTVAVSLYIDVLKPREATLKISFTDATFQRISNLTCAPLEDGEAPMVPRFTGDTPSNEIVIEGIITNSGNVAGQLRILDGYVYLSNSELEYPVPLAGIGEPLDVSRFLVEPDTTISFSIRSPIGRINSDGSYITEINLPVPPTNGRVSYSRDDLLINYITYNNGISSESSDKQTIDFFMEPFNANWQVDGKDYPKDFSCLSNENSG